MRKWTRGKRAMDVRFWMTIGGHVWMSIMLKGN
jgi:hypothetical protein